MAVARSATETLETARWWLGWALAGLVLGVLVWWWAPTVSDAPKVEVTVGKETFCGALSSADGGELRVKVDGEKNPRAFPLESVDNVRVKAACD